MDSQKPIAWIADDTAGYRGLTFVDPQSAEGAYDGWVITPLYAVPSPLQEGVAKYRALLWFEINRTIDPWGESLARQEASIDMADHLLVKFNELFPEEP